MKSVLEILKSYTEQRINGAGQDLDNYIEKQFKSYDIEKLKNYCQENSICIKHRDGSREDVLNRICGTCNSQFGLRILSVKRYDDDSNSEFYQRVYDEHFKGKDFSIKPVKEINNSKCKKYSFEIVKNLRKDEGLSKDDNSKDEEFDKLSPDEVFERVMVWNGIDEEMYVVKEWIEGIYGVKLGNK